MGTLKKIIILFLMTGFHTNIYANVCKTIQQNYASNYNLKNISKEIKSLLPPEFGLFLEGNKDLKVSWLDFSNLPEEIYKLNYCVNLSKKPLIGSGTRTGSVYFTKEQAVVFNFKSYKNKLGSGLNLLHEILGALGYPDENYQITTALYTNFHGQFFQQESVDLIFQELETYLNYNERNLENVIFDIEGASGGVTGVGGGGDSDLIPLKAFAINLAVHNKVFIKKILKDISFEEYFTFLFNIKLEPAEQIDPDFKHQFKRPGIYIAMKNKEWMVLIDKNIWNDHLNNSDIKTRSEFIFDVALSVATIMSIM